MDAITLVMQLTGALNSWVTLEGSYSAGSKRQWVTKTHAVQWYLFTCWFLGSYSITLKLKNICTSFPEVTQQTRRGNAV